MCPEHVTGFVSRAASRRPQTSCFRIHKTFLMSVPCPKNPPACYNQPPKVSNQIAIIRMHQ